VDAVLDTLLALAHERGLLALPDGSTNHRAEEDWVAREHP
jgi:hypothetical protein